MVAIHSLYVSLFVSSLIVSAQALASDFRGELEAGYAKYNVDYDGVLSQETRTQSLAGTYYFTPVDTQNKPLAEAAFLSEHSYIRAGYTGYRASWTWADEQVRRVAKRHTNYIDARVYVPHTPLVLGYGDSFADDDHFATYMLGLAPIEGLLVYTYYWREDDIKSRTNLHAEYVRQLADEQAVRINFSYTDAPNGDKNVYGVSADYYFNRYCSAGFSLGRDGTTTYGLNTRYFINEQWSLFAQYYTQDDENVASNRIYGLGVAFRL